MRNRISDTCNPNWNRSPDNSGPGCEAYGDASGPNVPAEDDWCKDFNFGRGHLVCPQCGCKGMGT